ncbi:MAG: hypothetical protein FJ404_15965, partial [Verrucomicrobia bacterium]|nr:hypothetical protein [Verrucomicrobiota bacterium]
MPTPSESPRRSDFGTGRCAPPRSIFENYHITSPETAAVSTDATRTEVSRAPTANAGAPITLQTRIDSAWARSFLYRLLAQAYENPEPGSWQWLTSHPTRQALRSTVQTLADSAPVSFMLTAAELAKQLTRDAFEGFLSAHVTCFGHTVRGDCPMNEIEYGDIKADPLFQPHRLADLGAFYAAFGLEMSPDAAERQDHVCIELEFMSVLAAKEAFAHEHQLDEEQREVCCDAQRAFLRERTAARHPRVADSPVPRRSGAMLCGNRPGRAQHRLFQSSF